MIKIILIYFYLKSLLETIIFFYLFICHIGKQIDIWRVKFIEAFGDALRFERKVLSINASIKSTSIIPSFALWDCLTMLKMFSSIVMLPKDNCIFPVLQWMWASAVAKKGRPSIIGMCFLESCISWVSITMKSTGK